MYFLCFSLFIPLIAKGGPERTRGNSTSSLWCQEITQSVSEAYSPGPLSTAEARSSVLEKTLLMAGCVCELLGGSQKLCFLAVLYPLTGTHS